MKVRARKVSSCLFYQADGYGEPGLVILPAESPCHPISPLDLLCQGRRGPPLIFSQSASHISTVPTEHPPTQLVTSCPGN